MVIVVRENIYMQSTLVEYADEVFSVIDANREYLRKWLGWVDDTCNADAVRNVISSWENDYRNGSDIVFGIFADGRYVGNIGIHSIRKSNNSAMIGYWLAEKYQKLGIVSDCVRKLTDFCFDALELNRVYIYCAVENDKSRAVPKRLGFVEEGVLQEAEYLYGKYYDLVVYGVVKKNWVMDSVLDKNRYVNTAHLYDLDQRDIVSDDIGFYKDYAKNSNGNILELACGTGRVSVELAKEGHNVTGLDISSDMLNVFRQKLSLLSVNVSVFEMNMSSFCLDNKFDLIIVPFRAFQALTEDKDIYGCLKQVHAHLANGGRFIINAFRPYKELDESWCYPLRVQWERTDDLTGNHVVKYHGGERIDTDKQIIYPHFYYKVTKPDGSVEKFYDRLKLKYYYYEQLKALLLDNNFDIVDEFGWYDKSGITDGRELIFVCSAKN